MKTLKNRLILLFVFMTGIIYSQTIIELRTGMVPNTNQVIFPTHADQEWKVVTSAYGQPPSNPFSYNTTFVSNGYDHTNDCYFGNSYQFPLNSGSQWITPKTVNTGIYMGEFDQLPTGYYFWRKTFFVPAAGCGYDAPPCVGGQGPNLNSVSLFLKFAQGTGFYVAFYINGYKTWINSTLNLANSWYTVPGSIINFGGQNEIIIETATGGCEVYPMPHHEDSVVNGPIGLNLEGKLFVNTGALTDKHGNVQNKFCIYEDIYFAGASLNSTSYDITLLPVGGGTPLVSTSNIFGSPNWKNITQLFKNPPYNYNFVKDVSYMLRIRANTNCGAVEIIQPLILTCCAAAGAVAELSADFKLGASATSLKAEPYGWGNHSWKVYSTPDMATGPYTPVFSTSSQKVAIPISGNQCYYVEHTLKNVCVEICRAQSVCNVACGTENCILSGPPTNLANSHHLLSWTPVPGASYYTVEVFLNDNSCCTDGTPGLVGTSADYRSYTTAGNSFQLDPDIFITGGTVPNICYSWRVTAVCPDGSSKSSSVRCL